MDLADACVDAFKGGNKFLAEELLLRVKALTRLRIGTTTFIPSDFTILKPPPKAADADPAYLVYLHTPGTDSRSFECLSGGWGMLKSVSLLHLAAYWGWKNVVKSLVLDSGSACPKDFGENVPMHYAAYNGQLEVVKYFTMMRAYRNCSLVRNMYGNTPLHIACEKGHLSIVKYLICEACYHPSYGNKNGYTPLHLACTNDHLNLVQCLIEEAHYNPTCKDNIGNAPLHVSCIGGHLKIVQYLIEEVECNPSCENSYGWTPLHFACLHKHVHIVQYLLSTGRVNPLAALSIASRHYDLIKLFQPFEQCRVDFPVHTFTKVILTGDSGAGKTTISELFIRLASSTAVECITDVQRLTAGIVPHHIQSKQLGNLVIYDFAGQQEYYSSHTAVLEQVMRKSAAMFLCVVDLSKSEEKICESLYYWLSFIDNASSTAEGISHVAVIGSHADQVTSLEEEMEKSSLLHKIAKNKVRHQQYAGFLSVDCRYAYAKYVHDLIAMLTNSHKAIAASQPVISYYCHVVYAFLRTKLRVVGCTLHDLVSAIANEKDSSLPNDQSVLIEILTILSDKGLILFLHNDQSSWIVVKTEALLNEINGTLFAPYHFKEHRDLASNTGIVPVPNLRKVFPDYNSEMLVGFLTSLDFCRPVDPLVLQYTNLQTTHSHSTANLLFFPGLVQSEQPDSLVQQGALKFGWCLKCMDPHEFFSSRFLHVLLLSVAYKFPLASQAASSSVSGLQRTCKIWRNGIFWRNLDNITTVIELLDKNRCVLVAMSCDDTNPVEHAELRSSLIGLVRHFQQQYCPRLNVCEFLISLDLIQRYPLDNLPDSDLFDMHHVARSMLLHKKVFPVITMDLSFSE